MVLWVLTMNLSQLRRRCCSRGYLVTRGCTKEVLVLWCRLHLHRRGTSELLRSLCFGLRWKMWAWRPLALVAHECGPACNDRRFFQDLHVLRCTLMVAHVNWVIHSLLSGYVALWLGRFKLGCTTLHLVKHKILVVHQRILLLLLLVLAFGLDQGLLRLWSWVLRRWIIAFIFFDSRFVRLIHILHRWNLLLSVGGLGLIECLEQGG